jgi:hypothetical protein
VHTYETARPVRGGWISSLPGDAEARFTAQDLESPVTANTGRKVLMLIALSTGGIVLIAGIYLILLITLGIMSIRKGHWVMFIIGIFLPLFWIIGALMPPKNAGPGSATAY